jgi:hypothetical protein
MFACSISLIFTCCDAQTKKQSEPEVPTKDTEKVKALPGKEATQSFLKTIAAVSSKNLVHWEAAATMLSEMDEWQGPGGTQMLLRNADRIKKLAADAQKALTELKAGFSKIDYTGVDSKIAPLAKDCCENLVAFNSAEVNFWEKKEAEIKAAHDGHPYEAIEAKLAAGKSLEQIRLLQEKGDEIGKKFYEASKAYREN